MPQKRAGTPTHIGLRATPDLVARLDSYMAALRPTLPAGVPFNRSDAVRTLLMQALDAFEAEATGGKRSKR